MVARQIIFITIKLWVQGYGLDENTNVIVCGFNRLIPNRIVLAITTENAVKTLP